MITDHGQHSGGLRKLDGCSFPLPSRRRDSDVNACGATDKAIKLEKDMNITTIDGVSRYSPAHYLARNTKQHTRQGQSKQGYGYGRHVSVNVTRLWRMYRTNSHRWKFLIP